MIAAIIAAYSLHFGCGRLAATRAGAHDSERQVLFKRIEVAIGVQQRVIAEQAECGDETVGGLADGVPA